MRCSCLFVFVLCWIGGTGRAQLASSLTFSNVDNSELNQLVFGFVENSSKFDSYGCGIEIAVESTSSKHSSSKVYDIFIADNSSTKLRRIDKRKMDLGVEVGGQVLEPGEPYELTVISAGDESKFFRNYHEIDPDSLFQSERPLLNIDPWNICLSETSLLESGRAGDSNYWSKLLDDKRLLWSETSSDYARGEWAFGETKKVECHVQVYFDLKKSKMPVLVRFIRPVDKTLRFAKFGSSFVSENEITWERFRVGFVPTSVQVKRLNYSSKGILRGTDFSHIKFKWKSSLETSKGIDPKVFSVGGMKLDEILSSFR
jgi:hypothetical protein